MHSALPMLMSYDIYTFVYSILREPKVWEFIRSPENENCKFMISVKLLFIGDDFNKIVRDCENRYKELNILKLEYDSSIAKYTTTSTSYFMTTTTNPAIDLIKQIKIDYNKIVHHLTLSRSLTNIVEDLTRLIIKLRVNIDNFYTNYGINPPQTNMTPHSPIKLYRLADNYSYTIGTSNYHICIDECKNDGKYNVCTTNKYSSLGYKYTKGLCKPNS